MVGAKPNAYLSEEARLEAQRRMLAERYGLLSDDSDDGDASPTPYSPPPPPPPRPSNTPPTVAANGVPPENGQPPSANTSSPMPTAQPPPSSSLPSATQHTSNGRDPPPHALQDPAPSEAATYGEGSSIHGSDLTFMSQDGDTDDKSAPADPTVDDRPVGWPAVELIDPSAGNRIRASYVYTSALRPDASQRNLRVTAITVYASQFLQRHERKIAVNDHIITYAVGGHIRAILRHSSARSLLKGHDSSVADVEFLFPSENRIDPSGGDNISILGSVADDGSVYVWKIIRNDSGSQDTLEVADDIRFEHPDYEKGRSYRRIAFRPGPNSIIAENGIGVALLLLDGEATDLRVVEVVKMNDKMMVRDKFLRARNEILEDGDKPEGNIDAATWLSERYAVTSRGGYVFIWNADQTNSYCIARIPREKTTRVTGLHAIKQDVLLMVVEAGRELELWAINDLSEESKTLTLTLRQTIRLFPQDAPDICCVASVDPGEELVTISNVKNTTFFALHYNQAAQAFDTITEVPVKQPIFSFCTTRKSSEMPSSPTNSNASPDKTSASSEDELGVWCFQSRGIQLIHLPAKDCNPRSSLVAEVHPKPIPKSLTLEVEKMPPGLAQQNQGGSPRPSPVKGKDNSPSNVSSSNATNRRVPRSMTNAISQTSSPLSPRPSSNEQSTKGSKAPESPSVSGSGSTSAARSTTSALSDPKPHTSPSTTQHPSHTNKTGSSPSTSPSSAQPAASANEVSDAILAAAKKVIEKFEEGGVQRSTNDKAKMERLIDQVGETAESNLERYVNSSMKKAVSEFVVPGMSQFVAKYRNVVKKSIQRDSTVTKEHYERAIEESHINRSFANACDEMTRQLSAAVSESMTAKYDSLIKPTVGIVNDAAEDLSASATQLRKQVAKLKSGEIADEQQSDVVEIRPEEVRQSIEEQVSEGNVDGAFLTALDKEDLELVTWLCGKFDSSSFFETYSLSQTAMLSLAQQLGHGLPDEGVELKVDWLRELMLVLDPEADDIEPISLQAVQGLLETVKGLKDNKELLERHSGLEKKLKTLGRLIASHLPKQ